LSPIMFHDSVILPIWYGFKFLLNYIHVIFSVHPCDVFSSTISSTKLAVLWMI
jgi:hypothetical protein